MTVEDFITLTEMRDGLSSLARVGELLLVIQDLKDPDTGDVVDALRQWSTVASTLMATKNKECLNQFLSLNGHSFLNKWLQKALVFSEDGGNLVVELINSLLTSFERLPIDIDTANSSGIAITIKHLLDHKCFEIKDKARILFDKWNIKTDGTNGGNLVKDCVCEREESISVEGTQMLDISKCNKADTETCEREHASMESQHSGDIRFLDSSHPYPGKNEMITTSNQFLQSTSSNCINSTTVLGEVDSSGPSVALNCNQESSSIIKESSAAYTSGVTCISHCDMDAVTDGEAEQSLNYGAHSTKEEDTIPLKSYQKDAHSSALSSAHSVPESVQVVVEGLIMSNNLDSKTTQSCAEKNDDLQYKDELNCHMDKCSTITEESKSVVSVAKCTKHICGIGRIGATDDSQSRYHKMEAVRTDGPTKEFPYQANLIKVIKKDATSFTYSLKSNEGKCIGGIGQKSEFGILDDALEVARQVAIAVEREVVDYREPFCSSPEGNSMEAGGDCNHDSEGENLDQTAVREVDLNASSSANEDDSSSESSTKEASEITQSVSSDLQKSEHDIESPKPNTSIKESVGKSNKEKCDLDLNVDIHIEEHDSLVRPILDITVNVSAPIPIVASSKGAPIFPFIPLHFDGEMGWKGSAATSAFRPASSRRTPEGEKTHSGSKHNSSKFFEIDLNIADCQADVECILVKQLPASAGIPSGDSSVEVSSTKAAERLKLDLNCLGDEDVPTYPPKIYHHSTEQSLSSASSARQSSLRDFDLNDNPSFIDIGGSHYFDKSSSKDNPAFIDIGGSHYFDKSSSKANRYGGSRLDDPVMTLMGSTMPAEGKNFFNQPFLTSGLRMYPAYGTRPALPYDQMPPGIYGYSGFPTVSGVSVPQPFYVRPGNFTYMVGSGGSTVFPQVITSGGFNGAPSTRPPPFMLNISNAPSSSVASEALSLGPDLNSGTTSVDNGNQGGGVKQFLWQGHGSFVHAQTKATQPSGSGITLKRKEPESGLDFYHPYGYKHMTPWQ